MSIPNDYDDGFDDEGQPTDSSVIKRLRQQQRDQAAELKELREQAERAKLLEAEVNLHRANLGSLNEAQQAAVLATTKEMSAEALRSQAELLGFVAAPEPAVPAADLAVFDRVAAVTAGADAPTGDAAYQSELDAAASPEEVEAIMLKHTGTGFYQQPSSP